MFEEKLRRLQASIRKAKLDGLVLCNPSHETRDDMMYYLLLRHLERGFFFIPAKGKPTLYAISFEAMDLAKAFPHVRVLPLDMTWKGLLHSYARSGIRLGYRGTLPTPLSVLWNDPMVMAIKFPSEIAAMRVATRATDAVFKSLLSHWREFKTELDAAQFIHLETLRHGFEPSFSAIVATGVHAASPHHEPQRARLQKGFCVIDMGVRAHGYCSDMTRTVYLGKPSKKEHKIYAMLQTAQTALCKLVKPDVRTGELDAKCRRLLGSLAPLFIHGLGHGVGTQVHEWPSLGAKSDAVLEDGMVITIEPGIYKKGVFGMRIEDDVMVTKHGSLILTKSPKQLISLL